ncbi:MAG: RNA-binding S4 domain-containing protein [Rhodospirillales bacterium]|jgi:ribosome-associated heat shock protein Hsp15|nr:RNA-binding S4 domain-containing protein [Rhodospirillales bacterium]
MNELSLRIDKWLWYARFFKSRTLASTFCASSRLRLNEHHVSKAHQTLRVGDVLTFPLGDHVRVIEVIELGTRRGPATEAQMLYKDLDPPKPRSKTGKVDDRVAIRERGAGRPTKTERRATDRLREQD